MDYWPDGGDLNPNRLLEAYRKGIFPWYSETQPIMWWSPDPRCVLLSMCRNYPDRGSAQDFTTSSESLVKSNFIVMFA